MNPMRSLQKLLFLLLVFAFESSAFAFSIWGRTTDDSVCDLGPRTTERISQRQLIPARSPDEALIYERLITKRIIDNCRNGQVLILHTDHSDHIDERALPEVSKGFCTAAGISRTNMPSVDEISGAPRVGFEIKCTITKFKEATESYLAAESKRSTDSMLQEAYRVIDQRNAQGGNPDSASSKPDCSKITMATIFFGGSGCK